MKNEISHAEYIAQIYTSMTLPPAAGAALSVAVETLPEQQRDFIDHLRDVARGYVDATERERLHARDLLAKLLTR